MYLQDKPFENWNNNYHKAVIPWKSKHSTTISCSIKSSIKKPGAKNEYTIISKEIKEDILKANEALEDKEAVFEANKEAEAAEKQKEEAEAQAKAAAAVKAEKEKAAAEANKKEAAEAKK